MECAPECAHTKACMALACALRHVPPQQKRTGACAQLGTHTLSGQTRTTLGSCGHGTRDPGCMHHPWRLHNSGCARSLAHKRVHDAGTCSPWHARGTQCGPHVCAACSLECAPSDGVLIFGACLFGHVQDQFSPQCHFFLGRAIFIV